MTEHLQVLHLNVGKQRQAQWSMLNDKSLSKYAMLAVVEPHLDEDSGTGSAQCGTHRQWQPLTPSVHRQDSHARYAYRAMLWVNTGIQAIQAPIPSYDIAAATIETAGGTVLVISAYDSDAGEGVAERDRKLHRKLAFIRQAIDDTRRARGEDLEVLLCADFNRHDALWGAAENILRYRRDEGVPIIHPAHEYSLRSMLPTGTITWEHLDGHRRSTVDIVLASSGLAAQVVRCWVHENDHGSDHRPIAIEFDVQAPCQHHRIPRMLPEKANWRQIGTEIQRKLKNLHLPEVATPDDLDDVAETFQRIVVDVVHSNVPRAQPSPHAKRWWTAELSLLRRSLSSARNYVTTLRRRGFDAWEAHTAYQAAPKEYFQQIEQQKKLHWKEFLGDPQNIWKANRFTRVASQNATVPTLAYGGVTAENDEEKASMLMAAFFPTPPEPSSGRGTRKKVSRTGMRKVPQEIPKFTDNEIRQAIFRSNPWKAPGVDEITFEMWRQLLRYVAPWIRWMYQNSLDLGYTPRSWRTAKIVSLKKPGKADYTVPKAYRPISLLPTISKGLEAIIASRLSYLAERYGLLPTNHFGARKQRSCEQALDVLVEKIFEAWRANRVLSLVTFDVQGAFNGVHLTVLEERLRERGVPEVMVRWIRSFCEQRSGNVVLGNYTSALTMIAHAGIPQGSPLSPILYAFYNANRVEGHIGTDGGSIGFVDDFTHGGRAPTALKRRGSSSQKCFEQPLSGRGRVVLHLKRTRPRSSLRATDDRTGDSTASALPWQEHRSAGQSQDFGCYLRRKA